MTLQSLQTKNRLLNQLESRLVKLLREMDPDERQSAMQECEAILSQAGMLNFNPPRQSISQWAESLLTENPEAFEASHLLAENHVMPLTLETPQECVRSLVPMELDQ